MARGVGRDVPDLRFRRRPTVPIAFGHDAVDLYPLGFAGPVTVRAGRGLDRLVPPV